MYLDLVMHVQESALSMAWPNNKCFKLFSFSSKTFYQINNEIWTPVICNLTQIIVKNNIHEFIHTNFIAHLPKLTFFALSVYGLFQNGTLTIWIGSNTWFNTIPDIEGMTGLIRERVFLEQCNFEVCLVACHVFVCRSTFSKYIQGKQ